MLWNLLCHVLLFYQDKFRHKDADKQSLLGFSRTLIILVNKISQSKK